MFQNCQHPRTALKMINPAYPALTIRMARTGGAARSFVLRGVVGGTAGTVGTIGTTPKNLYADDFFFECVSQ